MEHTLGSRISALRKGKGITLRVVSDEEKVNLNLPMGIVKAGIKLVEVESGEDTKVEIWIE